jgi:imidazolonepropionase-like amidohydrolase
MIELLAITGGKILTISNGIIENGIILIKDGKIENVGKNISVPQDYECIDVSGKIVMPGLIEAHCHIGIGESAAAWAGTDYNEISDPATPHMRAIDGIKVNSDYNDFEAALKAGITTVQILPGSANVIGGTGVVLKTVPKTIVDEMVILEPSGMKVAFGENPKRVYGESQKKVPYTRMAESAILREWLSSAKTYLKKKELFANNPEKLPDLDLKLEALGLVLKHKIPLRVHAHRSDDLATAIRIAEEFNVDMSWEHGTEGQFIADWLAQKNIPVTWGKCTSGRGTKWENRKRDYTTLSKFHQAGVKFAIQTDAVNDTIGFLPICASLAYKDGLPYDAALKSITLNAAEIIGLEERIGSIEKGKDADLRILDGDPLDIIAKVEMVLVNGEVVYSLD